MAHLTRLIEYKKNMLRPLVEKAMDGSVIESEELLSEQSKNEADAIDIALEDIAKDKGVVIVRNLKKHSLSLGTRLDTLRYMFCAIFENSTTYSIVLSMFLFTITCILSILKNAREKYEVFEKLSLLDNADVIFNWFLITTEIVTLFVLVSLFLPSPTTKIYGRKVLLK